LDVILDEVGWLCQGRKDYSPTNDVGDLCRNSDRIKPELQKILLVGDYTFQPLAELRLNDENIEICSARALWSRKPWPWFQVSIWNRFSPGAAIMLRIAAALKWQFEPLLRPQAGPYTS
jgi:hypothetical protein